MGFWDDRKVLITGGAGFLGSHLVGKARQVGCEKLWVPRRHDYDLVQFDRAKKLFEDSRPDLVFHLAARVGGIGANKQNPGLFFYENMQMGAHIIECARIYGVEKVVIVGTVCAYPKFTPVPFREDDLWNGYPEETNAPYGIAKRALLVQCQSYRAQYGLNAIFLLPTNLYGPGDNFDPQTSHVIPALVRKCLEAKERGSDRIVVWGDGSPSREFLYVEDAAEALAMAAERYNGCDPVNVGSGMEITIRDLVTIIARLTGFEGQIVWDRSKPNGQPRRALDVSKAERLFMFRAHTPFEEGLKRTVDWYLRRYPSGRKLADSVAG